MNNDRRLEIFGILLISISIFILISLLGYNSHEEPLISSKIKIENPTGIFGVYISHTLIKLGIGFGYLLIQILGLKLAPKKQSTLTHQKN